MYYFLFSRGMATTAKENLLTEETIQTLWKQGIHQKDELQKLSTVDITGLRLSEEQRLKLEAAVERLNLVSK